MNTDPSMWENCASRPKNPKLKSRENTKRIANNPEPSYPYQTDEKISVHQCSSVVETPNANHLSHRTASTRSGGLRRSALNQSPLNQRKRTRMKLRSKDLFSLTSEVSLPISASGRWAVRGLSTTIRLPGRICVISPVKSTVWPSSPTRSYRPIPRVPCGSTRYRSMTTFVTRPGNCIRITSAR